MFPSRAIACALAALCWTSAGACNRLQPSSSSSNSSTVTAAAPQPQDAPEAAASTGPAPASASASAGAPVAAAAPAPAPAPPVAAVPAEATLAEARQFYAQRCSLCHGASGQGDGVAAVNLRPRPRTFVDRQWQAATKDEDVAMVIVRGGRAIGRSMMMPASGDLADRPELVRALVAVVRSFGPAAAADPAPK